MKTTWSALYSRVVGPQFFTSDLIKGVELAATRADRELIATDGGC
jgi:hypothetical protein